ncbi:ATP synthase F1 subunit epsilon [Mariniblastus sp.]|nr:ATP synthase F1 subunit epsilon [Mariniblastus sp.]
MAQIQLVIVTPETTIFDKSVESVVLPLIDGEAGIYPNHSAMIGRLGPGELRAKVGGSSEKFYVDGGFVQIENNTVTVLPGVSIPSADVVLSDAKAALEQAKAEPAGNADLAEIKAKNIAQARAKVRIAEKS